MIYFGTMSQVSALKTNTATWIDHAQSIGLLRLRGGSPCIWHIDRLTWLPSSVLTLSILSMPCQLPRARPQP